MLPAVMQSYLQPVLEFLAPYQNEYGNLAREYLPLWLLVVAAARMFACFLGAVAPETLLRQVYQAAFHDSKAKADPTRNGIFARLFSTWTTLACVLAVLCALNPDNHALYLATFISFVLANLHFTIEFLCGNMTFSSYVRPMYFATISIALMLLAWPRDGLDVNFTKLPEIPAAIRMHLEPIVGQYMSSKPSAAQPTVEPQQNVPPKNDL